MITDTDCRSVSNEINESVFSALPFTNVVKLMDGVFPQGGKFTGVSEDDVKGRNCRAPGVKEYRGRQIWSSEP